ncbi:MAG: outer membrane protein assembly factor BamD [Fimbriimonadaceae bacterium]|nr:outer membrane protein assembly factor BamD [Chitinophagales bacterium]
MYRSAVLSAFAIIILFASGCSGYEKLLKSDDFDTKQIKAQEYYNEGDYAKALPLLDQLLAVKSGTAQEEEIRYFIAYCHYGQSEFLLSASLFKSFWLSFPRSYRAEECLYMSAYCLYKSSPGYELDQTETEKALESFQFFVDTYDKSERIQQCNDLMDEMRLKMEKKMYESANLYYNTENYQAAAITYENMLKEFPETKEAEDVGVLIIRSYFNYAVQSIICKKEERYNKAIASFNQFKEKYPASENMNEAESLYKRSVSLKEKALNEKENYNCNE